MNYTKEVSNKLNDLLEKNYDAEKGYQFSAENVKNPSLRSFFSERAKERYNFGHELKSEITDLGEKPDKGSSLKGDIHRSWMNLKATFSSDKEEAILEEAIRGEEAAVEEYTEVLEDENIPPSTANLLMKQRNAITSALNKLKTLESEV